jgi:acetylornithine deacetylase/succinyl-diaminopimelate desuccinylase-like protein
MKALLIAAVALTLTTPAVAAPVCHSDKAKGAADAWRATHEKAILEEFTGFLALPDVATTVPDVENNAAHLVDMLHARGFTTKILSAGPGTPPSVYAELKTPGAKRTVLYYAHYDGQPVSQKGWVSKPFEPVMRSGPLSTGPDTPAPTTVDWKAADTPLNPDWRLYARASGDDKASIEALLVAMDALKARGVKPSVNIKLFYEGEEEQGSPHLKAIVDANRELLKTDLIVMGDGPMNQTGRQMVNFGSRGVVGAVLTVYGPLRPLHDGHYGSWAPSPAVEIAHLVAGLRAENGDIAIKGFYDDVLPPSAAEKAALAALPPVEEQLKHDLGIAKPATDQRLADSYFRPTLNIRSIHVGDAGENAANAIATSGFASIDFRIVPDETPERVRALLRRHLTDEGWFVVDATPDLATRLAHPRIVMLRWDAGGSAAVKTDLGSPAARAATTVIEKVEGGPILKMPMVGASSGMAVMVESLQAPMIGVSIANFDDNQHAENENLRLGNLWDGVEVYAGLLSELDW